MTLVTPSQSNPGETIEASDINTPVNQIAAVVNGNLDDTNISSLSGTKIAAGTLPRTAFDSTALSDWGAITGSISAVAYNGNRSYSLTTSADNTGTISPGARLRTTRTVAAPTQCADLENGSSQYFTKTSATGFATGTTWTLKAKIKPESYTAGVIAALDDGTNLLQMHMLATGQIVIGGGTFAAQDTVTSYQSVSLDKWQDITASITIGTPTGEIRFDDTVVPSVVAASAATTMTIGTPTFSIGRNTAGTYFDGKVCQVAIFNAVISDATLKTYSSQTQTGSETSCKGFWSLNNTLTDLSASGNTLTAGGGAVATNADSPFGGQAGGTISSTLDYGIVQKITASTITVQVPEGCTIPTSGGVSACSYSKDAAPHGFPKQRGKWKIKAFYRVQQQTVVNTTTTALIGAQIVLSVGDWITGESGTIITTHTGTTNLGATVALSTSTSAFTNDLDGTRAETPSVNASMTQVEGSVSAFTDYSVSTQTTLYLVGRAASSQSIYYAGTTHLTFMTLEAENALL